MEQRLSFVTVSTADLDASRAFYVTGLGWTPLLDVLDEIIFFQVAPGITLGLFEAKAFAADLAGHPAASTGPSGLTLSQNVDSEAAVDARFETACAAGGTAVKAPTHASFGGYHCHVAEPERGDLGDRVQPGLAGRRRRHRATVLIRHHHGRMTGTPRWAAVAAWIPLVCVLPSSIWRTAVGLGVPLGWSQAHLDLERIPGYGTVYVISLSVFSMVAAALTLGLVRPWGERVPAWVPGLRGRRIPVLPVAVIALVGATLVLAFCWLSIQHWSSVKRFRRPADLVPRVGDGRVLPAHAALGAGVARGHRGLRASPTRRAYSGGSVSSIHRWPSGSAKFAT